MIDFSTLKALQIPEGEVMRIDANGVLKWEASVFDLYQRVESITTAGGSSGGWFFVEDFIGDNTSGMEMTYSVSTFKDAAIMGASTGGTNSKRFYTYYPMASTRGYYGWNEAVSCTISWKSNTKYTVRLNWLNDRYPRVLDANGESITEWDKISGTLTTQKWGIGICKYKNSASGQSDGRPMTLYSARLSQGSEVVRDYLPCYLKSNPEVIGLLDLVTKTFLPSKVQGGFTKGADIDW